MLSSRKLQHGPVHLVDAHRLLIALALVIAVALVGAAGASAASFTVTDTTDAALGNSAGTACVSTHGGSCTLRAAVQAADNTGGASTITLPAGDFKLTIPSTGADEPANGDLDVKGSSTAITLTGAGSAGTIIDANHIDRAFAVQSGESLTVSGVTVRNGVQPNTAPSNKSSAPGDGGAFLNYGSLTVEQSVLTGSSAAVAGGVISSLSGASSTSVIDSTVEHNAADSEGGVLGVVSGSVTLTGDTIEHNTAESEGAVLYYDKSGTAGAVTVSGSTISHNAADSDGGAFYLYEATSLAVSSSTFDDNISDDEYGGAIYAEKLGPITVEGSTFSGNSTGDDDGGAIYTDTDGRLTVSSSTFDGNNVGDDEGGAIYLYDTDLTLSGSSFHSNDGGEGGAVYIEGTSATAAESITTSTFAGNHANDSEGGAIYDDKGNLQISNSTFTANGAAYAGGALYYDSGDGLGLENDTFDSNQAGEDGGAIFFDEAATEGPIALLNDTITRNQAYEGGGIYKPEDANAIENTIVAGNYGGFTADGGGDCYGTAALDNASTTDKGGNIDGDGSCFSDLVSQDQTGVAPLLGELAANGGPTETDGLLSGSPAIASGVSTPIACPATDARGATRSGTCYVGAFQGVLGEATSGGSGSSGGSTTTAVTSTPAATTTKPAVTPPATCKSTRTETIDWKVLAGVHFKHIVVTRAGKAYRTLPGSARKVNVSMVGLAKGTDVVRITGTTGSGKRFTTTRTFHLCVAAKGGSGRGGSEYLTRA
jgi:predicted outer membrane repeat protein